MTYSEHELEFTFAKNQHLCQVVVVGGPGQTPSNEVAESVTHRSDHRNPPLCSAPIIALSNVSQLPTMTSPDGNDVTNHPGRHDDVTCHVVQVELDKGVLGLGFCIEGGRQSLTGDGPIKVKRIFRCTFRRRATTRIFFQVPCFIFASLTAV